LGFFAGFVWTFIHWIFSIKIECDEKLYSVAFLFLWFPITRGLFFFILVGILFYFFYIRDYKEDFSEELSKEQENNIFNKQKRVLSLRKSITKVLSAYFIERDDDLSGSSFRIKGTGVIDGIWLYLDDNERPSLRKSISKSFSSLRSESSSVYMSKSMSSAAKSGSSYGAL